MGQYYKPIAIKNGKGQFLYSHDYASGLKLMEHSYLKNNFVRAFETLITDNPSIVVWAGDYADKEKTKSPFFNEEYLKQTRKYYKVKAKERGEEKTNLSIERCGNNLYNLCFQEGYEDKFGGLFFDQVKPKPAAKNCQYIVNNTTKQFVDIKHCPKVKDGYTVHPLPLLTCEGNGRGGGDYGLENKYVGTWARNEIYVSNTKPENYTELKPDFKLDW